MFTFINNERKKERKKEERWMSIANAFPSFMLKCKFIIERNKQITRII